jgi:hypothetical protein
LNGNYEKRAYFIVRRYFKVLVEVRSRKQS